MAKNKLKNFKEWFGHYGDSLFRGYTNAKEDGSDETFTQWVFGEYSVYQKEGDDKYEVAYTGLFDN